MGLSKKVLVVLGIVAMLGIAVFLSACTTENTTEYTAEEVKAMEDAAYLSGQESVDITTDNQGAIDDYIATLPVEEEEVIVVAPSALYSEEYNLGDNVELSLDENEVEKLIDTEIEFGEDSIDVSESVELTSDNKIAYSGSEDYESEFGSNVYLVSEVRESVSYNYNFEDEVLVDDISENNPLEISFLGQVLSITDVDENSMTYFTKPTQYVHVGEVIDGVELVDVGMDSVIVAVDGEAEVVEEGDTETVNGVKVYVDNIFYRDTKAESAAVLVVGIGSQETVESGDDYGESANWVWDIKVEDGQLVSISVVLDEKFNRLDSDMAALSIGDCIVFPEEYLSVCLDKVSEPSVVELEIGFDTIEVDEVDVKVTELKASEDVLEIDGDDFSVLYSDGSNIYYADGSDFVVATDSEVVIDLNEADYVVEFGPNGEVYITDELGEWITINSLAESESLGNEDDAESTDILYSGREIGTFDEDVLTSLGCVIVSPESNADNDDVLIKLVDEQVEATIGVY